MANPVPERVEKIWDIWNIRGVISFSLSLQAFLILFASLRKATGNKLIIFLIWSSYLLADWAASFGIGLIAQKARDTADPSKQPSEKNELVALWAPFLLLHLGGPDTITAFALEDNELWRRQLLGLIFQAVTCVYIFLLLLPGNKLLLPTILMFIAGIIKYLERIRALHLASVDKFRDSTLKEANSISDDFEVETEGDYLEVAYQHFKANKVIILDLISSSSFKAIDVVDILGNDFIPEEALRIIEVELNLVYEVFHTKIEVVHSVLGIIFRFISFGSVMASLSVFYFHVKKQAGFEKFDVEVTYTLFVGAIALELISFLMTLFSDWTYVALRKSSIGKIKSRIAAILWRFLILKTPRWQTCHTQHSHGGGNMHKVLATPLLFRRWSGSVSGNSWIRCWAKARPSRVHRVKSGLQLASEKIIHYLGIDRLILSNATAIIDKIFQSIANPTNKAIQFLHIYKINALSGLANILDDMRFKSSLSHEPLTRELWEFICYEIKRKAKYIVDHPEAAKRIYSDRGDWIFQEWKNSGYDIKLQSRDGGVNSVPDLFIWHVATELLYYTADEVADENTDNAREFSKLLSDYILYLLVLKPTMMSVVADLTKLRLQYLIDYANDFFHIKGKSALLKPFQEKSACEAILQGFEYEGLHLDKARELANELRKLEEEKKWEFVSQMWVELLSYAAIQCNPMTHAQQVSTGGELITFVWLLMLHFDLVEPKGST